MNKIALKKQPKITYCSRCGDELTVDDLIFTQDNKCVLCCNMQCEAEHIHFNKHNNFTRIPHIQFIKQLF